MESKKMTSIRQLNKDYEKAKKIDRILAKIYQAIIKSKTPKRTKQLEKRVDAIAKVVR
jgi:hypothetical protein